MTDNRVKKEISAVTMVTRGQVSLTGQIKRTIDGEAVVRPKVRHHRF